MQGPIIGIDLAKNVVEVYVEDGAKEPGQRTRLSRKKMLPWFANRAAALIGDGGLWRGPLLGQGAHEAGA